MKRKDIRIAVSLEDICLGERSSSNRCPIARAVLRRIPGCSVVVDNGYISINGDTYMYLSRMGPRFIAKYDADGYVEPLTFYIRRGPGEWVDVGSQIEDV
jgi:hypothetical protein